MMIGYKVVHHQNHLAEHSNLLVRTLWCGFCLGHTSALVVIVAAILTMLCHGQPKEKHNAQFIESKVITASIVENCYHKYRFNQANQQKEWPHM